MRSNFVIKSKLMCQGLLACMCLMVPMAKAANVPTFAGSYSITGYFEPALTGSYTWCFDFVKTGSVLFPNSGTWSVPSYAFGWRGTWYQDGDEIILHGVADGTYFFSWKGRLDTASAISGRQVEFYSSGDTDTAGTFTGTRVASCPAIDIEASGKMQGSDPAK